MEILESEVFSCKLKEAYMQSQLMQFRFVNKHLMLIKIRLIENIARFHSFLYFYSLDFYLLGEICTRDIL